MATVRKVALSKKRLQRLQKQGCCMQSGCGLNTSVLCTSFCRTGRTYIISRGDVRGGRSPWSMNVIRDTCSELLNFVVSFFKSMFSFDNGPPRGPAAGPTHGAGRGPGSAAPPASNIMADANNIVTDIFDNIATVVSGDHGNVHIITSAEEWHIKVYEAKATAKIIVVDFFATWCGPCKKMAPVFEELSKKTELQSLIFVKMDIEEVSDVAATYDVNSMPTFLFIRDGQQIDKVVGADKIELEKKCKQYGTRP